MVRIDGFSSPDQYDDEAMSLWTHENYEDDELDIETSKYIYSKSVTSKDEENVSFKT